MEHIVRYFDSHKVYSTAKENEDIAALLLVIVYL